MCISYLFSFISYEFDMRKKIFDNQNIESGLCCITVLLMHIYALDAAFER